MRCPHGHSSLDFGRGVDHRRAYRCRICGHVWTSGHKGRRRFCAQRPWPQFHDTGAAAGPDRNAGPNWNETRLDDLSKVTLERFLDHDYLRAVELANARTA